MIYLGFRRACALCPNTRKAVFLLTPMLSSYCSAADSPTSITISTAVSIIRSLSWSGREDRRTVGERLDKVGIAKNFFAEN